MNTVSILESRRAILPEMSAYQRVLQSAFSVELIPDLNRNLNESIVWCFMGLHRKRPKCRFLIHDYRSLSTGRACVLRDHLKRKLNAKPDLRIFLNRMIRDIMAFDDQVPHVLLDMGVPESITDARGTDASPAYRFCYIGEISKERKSEQMLEAYVRSPFRKDPFLLIGRYDSKLQDRFRSVPSLHFAGRFPQDQVFPMLRQCEYAVCPIPNHRPYCYQTPTKLLEYGCLEKAIIANRSDSNLRVVSELGLDVVWTGDAVFDTLELPERPRYNIGFDARPLFWERRFRDSGLWDHLKSVD
jgi:hypothetical protein